MTQTHWSNYLVRGFPTSDEAEVTLRFDPDRTHGGMVLLASRIQGIFDALGPQGGEVDNEPLEAEDTTELLRLLDHLHRVVGVLTAQEDRLLAELERRNVGARTIATHMEVSHQTVRNRIRRRKEAEARGLNSQGWAEADGDRD